MTGKKVSFAMTTDEGYGSSEKEIVQATVDFLNGATIEFGGAGSVSDIDGRAKKADEATRFWAKQIKELGLGASEPDESAGDLQTRFRSVYRSLFSAFIKNPHLVGAKLSHSGISSELPAKTYLWPTEKGMTIVTHYWIGDFHELATVGQALLFDEAKPFAKKLCQCQRDNCGKFFFEKKPPTGRPTRKYCSKKHMLEAHDDRAPSRMTRIRSKPVRKK